MNSIPGQVTPGEVSPLHRPRPFPWGWVIFAGLLALGIGFIGVAFIGSVLGSGELGGPRVGVIQLSGAIADEEASGFIGRGRSVARRFMDDVDEAGNDKSIKAVVIRINSPGGSAAASQEMYQAVRRLRAQKPVICSMGDMAASGGYYVASGCDKIYANGSTLTGSIGVISQFMNLQGIFKKIGIDEATIKSGKFKDAGNPSRPLTPAERQLFQAMIMNVYNQFLDDVLAGRQKPTNGKLTRARLKKLADGRVYTGQQAKANNLIDELGGLHEAVAAAAAQGGITGKPRVREIGRGGLFGSMMESQASSSWGAALAQISNGLGQSFGAAVADAFVQRLKSEGQQSARPQLR